MKIKTQPREVFAEYQAGVAYKTAIGLYENVERNENFFVGNQWEGVNAPDLPKPTLNMLKRVVSYFTAMIVSDDVRVSLTPYGGGEEQTLCDRMAREIEQVIEECGVKRKHRDALRNAAVDGDGCFYLWFDPEKETGQRAKGGIEVELIENTSLHYGNPHDPQVQRQPYLILSVRRLVEEVRDEARAAGLDEEAVRALRADSAQHQGEKGGGGELMTVLIKLWRQDGRVWALKCTEKQMLKEPWCTDYRLYPVAVMPWDRVRSCCHGQSALNGLIPNQIAVNKLFAMAIRSVEMSAFPKVIYDATRIRRWSNRVGEAIAVAGNPNETVASGLRGSDMSAQVMETIDRAVSMTRDFLGASDAALGNVQPDNTSAIIAVQQAAAMPLELQKLAFYQFIEDYVRIMADMMSADYGVRTVWDEETGRPVEFDFSSFDSARCRMRVDVGASAYWSELMQVQTLDNLVAKGILLDGVEYLRSIPDQYLKNKKQLLEALEAQRARTDAARAEESFPPDAAALEKGDRA